MIVLSLLALACVPVGRNSTHCSVHRLIYLVRHAWTWRMKSAVFRNCITGDFSPVSLFVSHPGNYCSWQDEVTL